MTRDRMHKKHHERTHQLQGSEDTLPSRNQQPAHDGLTTHSLSQQSTWHLALTLA